MQPTSNHLKIIRPPQFWAASTRFFLLEQQSWKSKGWHPQGVPPLLTKSWIPPVSFSDNGAVWRRHPREKLTFFFPGYNMTEYKLLPHWHQIKLIAQSRTSCSHIFCLVNEKSRWKDVSSEGNWDDTRSLFAPAMGDMIWASVARKTRRHPQCKVLTSATSKSLLPSDLSFLPSLIRMCAGVFGDERKVWKSCPTICMNTEKNNDCAASQCDNMHGSLFSAVLRQQTHSGFVEGLVPFWQILFTKDFENTWL